MLDNRKYMRRQPRIDPADDGMRCLFTLIVVNVVMFLFFGNANMLTLNAENLRAGHVYELVTSLFMHASFMHVFFNMFSLYIFGQLAAPEIGAKRFLGLFLFSGVAGNLVWLINSWNNPMQVLLGASGAVMGVILAAAMMFPEEKMLLLFVPFPIKLRTMALVFIGIEFLSELTGGDSNVAYLAHIGGFLGGYLYMILFLKSCIRWDPLDFLSGKKRNRSMPRDWTVYGDDSVDPDSAYRKNHGTASKSPSGRVSQKELDALLDKISREGINALSEDEMERLRLAREQMRGS